MKAIQTLRDLLSALQDLSDEQLDLPFQAVLYAVEPVELLPAVAFGTIAEMQFGGARNVLDNKYHPDDLVLLLDHNQFSQDGTIAEDLMTGQRLYSNEGPTDPKSQLAPEN